MYKLLLTLTFFGGSLAPMAQAQPTLPRALAPAIETHPRFAKFPGLSREPGRSTSSTVRVPGSAVHYGWNGQAWGSPVVEAYTYDSQARLTRQADTDSLSRMPQTTTITTFDAAGNTQEVLVKNWNGSRLEDFARVTYAYDTHNNLTEELTQLFTQGAWNTVKGLRFQYSYNPAGKVVSKIMLRLTANNTYVNRERHLFTVPASGEWTAETIQQWSNNNWRDSIRTTMAVWHDFAKGQLQSANMEEIYGPTWVQFRLVGTFSPTLDRRTLQMEQGGSFVNHTSVVEEYDARGNMTSFREEDWAPGSNSWDTYYENRYLYTYNAAGDIVRRIRQYSEAGVTNGLQNANRDNYSNFQSITLASHIQLLPAGALQVFPNPSTDGHFALQARVPAGPVALRIIDALGREVQRQHYPRGLTMSQSLDLSQQPAGIYTLELSTADGIARQRLAVE